MLVLEAARRILLGSKIDFVIFACARLGSKMFSLGSLELEKFTLVPNTSIRNFHNAMCPTVWTFSNFTVTLILREISFG